MRILLKISGEALKGEKEFGIDENAVQQVAEKIKKIKAAGIEIAVVVGGGNIYRGSNLIAAGVQATDSHNMSMLSTVFNGMVLQNFLRNISVESVVFNPLGIDFLESYTKEKAVEVLEKSGVAIFVGGTGNPYFTTDTGGVLRALEIEADYMIKATKVDGIYTKDPKKYANAEFLPQVSYKEFLEKGYKIMDESAVVLAKENNLSLKVVELFKQGAIEKVIAGEKEGSEICI